MFGSFLIGFIVFDSFSFRVTSLKTLDIDERRRDGDREGATDDGVLVGTIMITDENVGFVMRRRLDVRQLDEVLLEAVVDGSCDLTSQYWLVTDLILVGDPIFANVV